MNSFMRFVRSLEREVQRGRERQMKHIHSRLVWEIWGGWKVIMRVTFYQYIHTVVTSQLLTLP